VAVLLTNSKHFDDIYAVSRSGGKTTLCCRVRDFKTEQAAREFILGGYVPRGYRGTVATVDRKARKIKPKAELVRSAVGARKTLPGQGTLFTVKENHE
jgi:hypothetical protein